MVTQEKVEAAVRVIQEWADKKNVTRLVTGAEITEFAVELVTAIDEVEESEA